MKLIRLTQQLQQRHDVLKMLLAMIGIVGLAAGCDLSTATGTTSSGAYYTITVDVKDSTTYPAATSLSVPIHVTHDGSAIGSGSVRWAVLSGHGHISDTISTTDTLGATHIVWTLGTAPEANALVFAIGDAVDTLHVTGVVGSPSYLVVVGAQSDTTSVGLPVLLAVVVKDRPGNAVSGASVIWTGSGGALSTSTTSSDATGTVTVAFAASEPGTYYVTADLPERATCVFEVVVR